jgi:hypothetical protein
MLLAEEGVKKGNRIREEHHQKKKEEEEQEK